MNFLHPHEIFNTKGAIKQIFDDFIASFFADFADKKRNQPVCIYAVSIKFPCINHFE